MFEPIVDRIIVWFVGRRISGWQTRLGGAATIVLAISGALIVVAHSLIMAKNGQVIEGLENLNSPEMWAALAALGITKQMLGQRLALDKLATARG